MADYISREAAIKELLDTYEREFPTADGSFDLFAVRIMPRVLRSIPAADVVPVRFTAANPSETVRDYYGTWGECQSCGYDDNTASAKYCGGCGTRLIWRTRKNDD